MIIVKARFTGTTSLGFISGNEYIIRIIDMKINSGNHPNHQMLRVETYGLNATKACEYGSWEMLISNWNILKAMRDNYEDSLIKAKVISYIRDKTLNKLLNERV